MRRNDLIGSVILIIFAVAVYILTTQFPIVPAMDTGPAFFPKLLSFLLLVLGIILFVQSVKKGIPEEQQKSMKKSLVTMLVVLFYLLGISYIGFFIATPIFVFVLLLYYGIRKKTILLSIPLGVLLFNYFFFEKILAIPLPRGIIF